METTTNQPNEQFELQVERQRLGEDEKVLQVFPKRVPQQWTYWLNIYSLKPEEGIEYDATIILMHSPQEMFFNKL